MSQRKKTNLELKKFLKYWLKANRIYKKITKDPTSRVSLPDPITKLMVSELFPDFSEYTGPKTGTNGTYDYDCPGGYAEVKSGQKAGNNPFSPNQNNCKRIVYIQFCDKKILIFDLNQNDVNSINRLVTNGTINIHLSKYTSHAILVKRIIA